LKSHLALLLIVITLLVSEVSFAQSKLNNGNLENVRLQLKWTHQFQFAGYYAAKEQGYYADEGLDVEFLERFSNITPVEQVTSGVAQYGIGSSGLVLDQVNGAPIKLLKAIFQHNPIVFISQKESNITQPYEIKAKGVMFDMPATEQVPLRSLLLNSGIKETDFTAYEHTHQLDDLLKNDIDVISAYLTNAPGYYKEKNIAINIINPRDFGVDFYGDILFTSEQEIQQHPERVQRFIRATLKGWEYAISNQEELVQLISQKYKNQLSIDTLRYEAKETVKLISADTSSIGTIDAIRLLRTAEAYIRLKEMKAIDLSYIENLIYQPDINAHTIKLTEQEQQWLNEHPNLSFTGDPSWLPYEAFNEEGEYIGIVAEHLKIIEQHSGIQFQRSPSATWHDSVAKMRSGEVDIISETVGSVLLDELLFTKPYLSSPIIIVMKEDQGYVDSIHSIVDKKIAVIKEYGYVHSITTKYPKLNYIWVDNLEQGLEAVASGQADALLSTLAHTSYQISKSSIQNIRIVGKTEFVNALALGVQKELAPLIPILDRALESISEQERQEIFDKWSTAQFAEVVNYQLIFKITALFLSITIIILYWNRTLRHEIDSRKKAEYKLSLSEQRFRSLLEAVSAISVQGYNAKREVIFWNKASENIYGFTEEEALGRQLEDLIIPDKMKSVVITALNDLVQQGIAIPAGELTLKDKKGKQVDVFSSHVMQTNQQGEAEIFCIDIDLRKRKQAEQALKQSEQRFHSFFDNAPLGVAIIDAVTGETLDANAQLSKILGKEKSELLSTPYQSFIYPDDLRDVYINVKKLDKGKINKFNISTRFYSPESSTIWLNMTVSRLEGEEGGNPIHLCLLEDVTANKSRDVVLRLLAESKAEEHDMFDLIVHQLTKLTSMRYGLICMTNQYDEMRMDTLSIYQADTKLDDISYYLQGTPCQNVVSEGTCFYPDHIQELFPEDYLLVNMEAQSYLGMPLNNSEGKAIGLLAILDDKPMDIHPDTMRLIQSLATRAGIEIERKLTQSQLNKLSLAVEHSPNAVMITNLDGMIEYINPKLSEITGYSEQEALGEKTSLLKSGKSDPAIYKELWGDINAGKEWRGELQNAKKNGELYWARESISPIFDKEGEITHFVTMQEDITESRRINAEITHQASHDVLTGLINRAEFERRLERVVQTAQEDNSTHALCFLDLDQFKVVNDSSGHVAGDELLRQLGTMLHSHVRQRDTLARIGGDEFAILMEHCGLEQATRTAEDVRALIEDFQFNWEDRSYRIGVSIGVSLISETSLNSTEILKQADLACYAAKDKGRNRVHIYHSKDDDLAQKEGDINWASRINEALNANYFTLYVQPIKPLSSIASNMNYEILLRLKERNGDIIPPGAFLPAVERYNLARKVDKWVVDNAFSWLADHLHKLDKIDHFSINLSGQSLGDEALLEHIITLLNNGTVPADKIVFEITETAAVNNLREATNFISILKSHGCKFSLDDFGSGLSSFAYLKNLRVDYLKIDGMFVKDILDDPIDAAMVRSINEIGHVMNIKTIAEFVENQEVQQQLEGIGVDFVQGYGISKPFPIDELLS